MYYRSFLINYLIPIGLLLPLVNCAPLYGEIESDIDTTKQSIVRANQILASINRDVDLCLSNSVACTLKNYDDLDYQTFEQSNSYSGNNNNESPPQPTTTGYAEVDEANVTLSPTIDSTGPPDQPQLYGRVPTIKIVVPPASDQKFTHVLEDIDSLEVHVQSAIANFTSTRRFTYTTMLKPMLKHIHQLRNNLSLLHHRLIGVAALTNIASQVNELTDHISDAIVGGADVPLDDAPPASSSSVSPSSPPSSSPTTTTTTTTTPPSPSSSTPSNENLIVNNQPISSTVLPTIIPSSTQSTTTTTSSSLPSSNPTTINDNDLIVETTTKTIIGLNDDNVDEITSTIKSID